LQALLTSHALDAFVVSNVRNLFYLTGFSGTAGLLVFTPAERLLILDGRYVSGARDDQTRSAVLGMPLDEVDRRYDLSLGAALSRLGARRVGFEAASVTVSILGAWRRAAPAVEWIPLEDLVEGRRLIKDAWEQEVFRRGGALIDSVAARLQEFVAAGRSERDVAADIDKAVLAAGFSGPSFATIVASGPNSARPHARPTERVLQQGDLVVLDFGGMLDGYCTDLTRVAAVGPVSDPAKALFYAVLEANRAAREAVRPGVDVSVIDQAARQVLEARGYGAAFSHATGHGLGLDVHEAPRVGRPDVDTPATSAPGMIFTVEPGAYVPGIGGARVEDDVLVTETGGDVLTDAPRELIVV
jgi:Xaa-Pro aminopeptidase